MNGKKEARIARAALFGGCRRADLRVVARLADELDVDAGRVLCQRGSVAREVIVVLDGTVVARGKGGSVVLGAGSTLGETAVLGDGVHQVTVETLTPCRVLVIESRAFVGLLERVPSVARKLLRSLAVRADADQSRNTESAARNLAAVS